MRKPTGPCLVLGLFPPALIVIMIACGRGPGADSPATTATTDFGSLVLTSPAFEDGGVCPAEFTCDGAGVSPPLAWAGVPAGTRSFALNVWHIPGPGDIKSYWVLYDIPGDVTRLSRGSWGVGITGLNDKRRNEYDPLCSKGPGLKTYHITLFALSEELKLDPKKAARADLLKAMEKITLSQKNLTYQYAPLIRVKGATQRAGERTTDPRLPCPPSRGNRNKVKGKGCASKT